MDGIKISKLKHPKGSELLHDSESYMKDLSELELDNLKLNGRGTPVNCDTPAEMYSITVLGDFTPMPMPIPSFI